MSELSIFSYLPADDPEVLEQLQDRIELVRHKLKFVELVPTVACISSLSPLKLAGGLVPELIRLAGGTPVELEDLAAADPQYIIVALEGSPLNTAMSEVETLMALPGWESLDAVKNGRIYLADGEGHFSDSPAGIVETIEMIGEILNPKQFAFGYEGEGWIKFGV
ncbi:MAG: ABC transporter substrate-binding protein [Arcticibacter sp.]